MGFHDIVQRNRAAVAVVALLVLIVSAWMMRPKERSSAIPDRQWFYDLGTGELFAYTGNDMPPIERPSGSKAVLAHVYACKDCDDANDRFVAFLVRFTEEQKQSMAQREGTKAPAGISYLVSRPSRNPTWFDSTSPEGHAVTNVQHGCSGQIQVCYPK